MSSVVGLVLYYEVDILEDEYEPSVPLMKIKNRK